jgi:hypothetical protein
MTQNSLLLINNFLFEYFPIKRIKSQNGKWTRVIIIDGGYIRNTKKIYDWNKNLDVNLVAVDLLQIIMDVFACNENEVKDTIINYIEKASLN